MGVSSTPYWWPNGRWQGNASPTSQSRNSGSAAPTTFCSVRTRGIRGGVRAIQCCGARSWSSATNRTWVAVLGMADSGARRLRQAGAAPTSANSIDPPWCPAAACSSVAHCNRTSRESNRPAAVTTSSGALSRCSLVGSRYQPDRSMAGTCTPARQLPSTGVRAGSRL
ncbi:Uncharacterised protein [Mycobacterium tuberculosis]|uniref:Uncharacterized protein n=1 Tax=Mycobacterium tuberculosis TaxID=1773 RepID=A0A655A279_MYCTX|nr:Uncharacterised protein [Mycobacterium tuberculosis]CKT73065.1 Uncharacterised protein [Mycobacterium tuberculosis]